MQVAVFPNPYESTPYLCVMYPGLDEIEVAAEKALGSELIPYRIVEHEDLPQYATYTFDALTVDVSGIQPSYGFDLNLGKTLASKANDSHWKDQYYDGLSELGASDLDVSLALSTPSESRTEVQQAICEFASEISQMKQMLAQQLAAATTGEELNSILATVLG